MQKLCNVIQLITGMGVGGAERVVCELSTALGARGASVKIVTLINMMGMLDQYPHLKEKTSCLNINKNPFSFVNAIFRLSRAVKEEKAQIIHAHMFHALLISIFVKAFNPKIKIVFTSHNFQGFSYFRAWSIKLTRAFRTADVVFNKNQHPQMNAGTTYIIPNCIKVAGGISHPREIEKEYTFIFIGRLETQKDPLALISALSRTKVKSNLLIIGDGYLLKDVKMLIKELNIESRVTLHGLSKDVTAQLLRAKCLVLCSLYEGLPMVVLEAGALGLPVISTPVGSVPELLSEDCGYLTEAHQLAELLDFVATNEEDARIKGINLYSKIFKHYSLDRMVNEHERLYRFTLLGTKN